MSRISIHRRHSLTPQQAQSVASTIAGDIEREYGVRAAWKGETLEFKGSGVQGKLHVHGKEIELEVHLGLMLFAFRDSIAAQIERKLDEMLRPKPASPAKKAIPAKNRAARNETF